MTKLRTPLTFADAVARVAGLLTYPDAAAAVGKGPRLVYKWANPDNDACPSLCQAIALDAAYGEAGGGGAPILEAYAAQLDIALTERAACRTAYTGELADVARECGEAFAAGVALTQPGASPLAIQRAMIETEQAHGAIGALVKRMKSFLPSGAGPGAGNTGNPQ